MPASGIRVAVTADNVGAALSEQLRTRFGVKTHDPHVLDALSTLVMRTAKPTTPKRPARSRFGVPKSGYKHGR